MPGTGLTKSRLELFILRRSKDGRVEARMPSVLTPAVSSIFAPQVAEFFRVPCHLSAFKRLPARIRQSLQSRGRVDWMRSNPDQRGERGVGEFQNFSGWPEGESAGP